MSHSVFRLALVLLLVTILMVTPAAAQAASRPAPAFTLELFSGKSLSLADLKGKAVIMLFWTQW